MRLQVVLLLGGLAFGDVQSVASDGSSVRLVFLVEFLLRARHAARHHSPDQAVDSRVLLVDSLVVTLARAGRCPVRGCSRESCALGLLQGDMFCYHSDLVHTESGCRTRTARIVMVR
jgi:hypothetical protein